MGFCAAIGTLVCAIGVARADVPLPSNDPFYAVPAGIGSLANGTIIRSRPVNVSALGVPLPVTAWQLEYKSLDNHDRPTAMVTTVLVPLAAWTGARARPLVSYQVPEDGADSKCAVSYALRGGLASLQTQSNASADTTMIASAVSRGWAVVASDYEGPGSAFFAAPEEAHGVLDGIRAALAFKPAGASARTPVGMWGYSGGGYATSVAAVAQPGYAPELNLVGAAIGSPTASVRAEVAAFSGSIAGGAIAMAIAALDRAYPEQHLQQYLNLAGRQAVASSAHDCLVGAAQRHPLAKVEDWEATPNALDQPSVTAFLRSISPEFMPGHPRFPVLLYHDRTDEFAPVAPALDMVAKWCAAGTPVQVHVEPVGEHIAYETLGAPLAMSYLTDRFAGTPAPSGCAPSARATPSPSPPPLRMLVLANGAVHLDRRGRVVLRVRNPNPFGVTLVGVSVRITGSHLRLLRRASRVAIGEHRARMIGLRARRAALRGLARRVRVSVQLIDRAPDGRTASAVIETTLVTASHVKNHGRSAPSLVEHQDHGTAPQAS